MTSANKQLALAMLRLATRFAPAGRKPWFAAMATELDHVPPGEQGYFASGCLLAAVHERLFRAGSLLAATRGLLVLGALVWAGMNVWFAGRMSFGGIGAFATFGLAMAAVFAAGAAATARSGLQTTARLAIPLIGLLTVAALATMLALPAGPQSALLLALIVEDLAILIFAVAIALAAPRLLAADKETRR